MSTAVCSVCGHDVVVRKDGKLRVHGYQTDPYTMVRAGQYCTGSNQPPRNPEDRVDGMRWSTIAAVGASHEQDRILGIIDQQWDRWFEYREHADALIAVIKGATVD